MNKNLRTRGIIIAVLTVLCLVVLFGPWNKQKGYSRSAGDFFKPSKLKQNLSENIKLGLDLKGGTHLVMQVQAEDAIKFITEGHRDKAKEDLTKDGIKFTSITATPGLLTVETPDASEQTKIKDKLEAFMGTDGWEATTSTNPAKITFKLNTRTADFFRKEATQQAKNIIEQRINNFGVAEPTVQEYGNEKNHQILVQMPGVDNPERVKELIKGQSRLDIRAVVPTTSKFDTEEQAKASPELNQDREVLPYRERRADGTAEAGYYIVDKSPVVNGSEVREARGQQNQGGGGYSVNFSLKPTGAEKFGTWTENNIGKYLAVVLNNEIKSVAVVRGKISDSGQIEGSFSREQAEDLGLTMRSGALPANIVYLEERTVGPSLGADSIRQGVVASVVGLLLVVMFMLFYYRFSGVNAVIGLLLNLIILMAGLAMFGATLTLPGIAGIILTIGMAVDSNVLIFERIREELRAGKIVSSAVDTGFAKALVTIIDTHVTTIVSAAFLYFFGTGPIRGFAVTLVIGLLANLFTAIYVSRSMFIWELNRGGRRAQTISI
ncbi:MAG: protein translocase subunit SecD [Acidobacteriota bacterium]|nr:protein translocase subunit SecD [Acidobacteriota bacterium]